MLKTYGWAARGGAWARDTTPEQFGRMNEFFAQAAPLYMRAMELEPGLIDAHIGLVSMSRSGLGVGGEARLVDQARRIAPGCGELAYDFMQALQPKWGGSYEAMLAYARVLEPEVAASPLIANQLAAPYLALFEAAHRNGEFTAEGARTIDEILAISSNEAMLGVAADANFRRSDGSATDEAKAVAYLLQRQRFNQLSPWQARQLGQYLMRQEPEWSLALLADAAARDPDSGYGHYYLGAANYNARRFEEAERHYLLAIGEPAVAQASLRELVGMWLMDAGLAPEDAARRAVPHLDELLRRYPDDGRARLFELMLDVHRDGAVNSRRMDAWLQIADPADPLQKALIDDYEATRSRHAAGHPDP